MECGITKVKDYYTMEQYENLHYLLTNGIPVGIDTYKELMFCNNFLRSFYNLYFCGKGNVELTRQLVNTVIHYGYKRINKLDCSYLDDLLGLCLKCEGEPSNLAIEIIHLFFDRNAKKFDNSYCKCFSYLIASQKFFMTDYFEKDFKHLVSYLIKYSFNTVDNVHYFEENDNSYFDYIKGFDVRIVFKYLVAYCYYKHINFRTVDKLFEIYRTHYREIIEFHELNGFFNGNMFINEELYKYIMDFIFNLEKGRVKNGNKIMIK